MQESPGVQHHGHGDALARQMRRDAARGVRVLKTSHTARKSYDGVVARQPLALRPLPVVPYDGVRDVDEPQPRLRVGVVKHVLLGDRAAAILVILGDGDKVRRAARGGKCHSSLGGARFCTRRSCAACEACKPGTYAEGKGHTACELCSAGGYCADAGADSSTVRRPCWAGTYGATIGATPS